MSEMDTAVPRSRRGARIVCGAVLLLLGLGLAASEGGSAYATSSSGNTTANVAVASSITLSGLTSGFTVNGNINQTATNNNAVTMNVLTNNLTGYNVTVQAAAASLSGSAGNTDTIPIADLKVKGPANAAFTSVSNLTALIVKAQVTASGASGDTITNDYQVDVPNVRADTYSVTLNYVASTQ
jgi:hypothetical protein